MRWDGLVKVVLAEAGSRALGGGLMRFLSVRERTAVLLKDGRRETDPLGQSWEKTVKVRSVFVARFAWLAGWWVGRSYPETPSLSVAIAGSWVGSGAE
jgi:hypothetical protein